MTIVRQAVDGNGRLIVDQMKPKRDERTLRVNLSNN